MKPFYTLRILYSVSDNMSKLQAIKGTLKVFTSITKEDWQQTDKKFYRLVFGVIGFAAMALFWYYFLRNIIPFGF